MHPFGALSANSRYLKFGQYDYPRSFKESAAIVDVPPSAQPSIGDKEGKNPKTICRKAGQQDLQLLVTKTEDELKAFRKVRAKKLAMQVVDAEYQWDRRKLTSHFIAENRIDFRELIRKLFRLYKPRIWMA